MKIKGNNTSDIPESATELSQKLSLFQGFVSPLWAIQGHLSENHKPLWKQEIRRKYAFINENAIPPLNNPTLSVFYKCGRFRRQKALRRMTRRFADGQEDQ